VVFSRKLPKDESHPRLRHFIGQIERSRLSDGGGIVRAARIPVCGRERVAKFIATAAHFWNGVKLAWVEANGQAAVLMSRDGVPVALTTINASEQGIDQIDP